MKIVFAGTPEIAATALRTIAGEHEIPLVITMPDAEVGRSRKMTASPVAQVASELGIPTVKQRRFDSPLVERIASLGADIGVVLAFGALIPGSALELFPWLNIHFSTLPAWRGASPLQQSMLSQTGQGFTIFKLDESMDTGPTLVVRPLQLDANKPAGELLPELTELATVELLERLEGELSFTPQSGSPSYAPKLTRASARINFANPADQIHRLVMAMNPEPMAWGELAGNPLRILRSKSLGSTDWNQVSDSQLRPGEIEVSGGKVLVACGGGTRLELIEVQPAGKKVMSALDWARGLQAGAILG